MNSCWMLLFFCFVLLLTEGECISCTPPKGSNCIPIGRPPASCITEVGNGTNLSWFDMQENCAKDAGRLVWLKDDFTISSLVATEKLNSATNLVVIGLLHSMKGDSLNFWSSPNDNSTVACGTEDTALCMSSSATEKQCNMIGCCWLNGKCQYPERQWLSENNGSDVVDTSAISGSSRRSCVGLQRSGKNWTFKAFDCTMPSAVNTGYVCEYKCQANWATSSLNNVSWPRSGSTGSSSAGSSSAGSSSTGSSSAGSSSTPVYTGTVITTTSRNGSGNIFSSQVLFIICGVTLLLMLYQATVSITI